MSDADALLGRFPAGKALLKLLGEQLSSTDAGAIKVLVAKLLAEAAGERLRDRPRPAPPSPPSSA